MAGWRLRRGFALGGALFACSGSPTPSGGGGAPATSPASGGSANGGSVASSASGGDQPYVTDLGACSYDPTLEAIVRAELKGLKTYRASDLSSLSTAAPLVSLTGLECLTGLRTLHLSAPEGSIGSPLDLSPLAGLTALTSLTLTGYDFNHLDALAGHPINILTLEDAPVVSVAFLKGLPALSGLSLKRLPLKEIPPLPELQTLSHLVLSELAISNLEAFRNLPELKSIYLTSLSLTDLRGIDGLPALPSCLPRPGQQSHCRPTANLRHCRGLRPSGCA
jgi:hypothetical protein